MRTLSVSSAAMLQIQPVYDPYSLHIQRRLAVVAAIAQCGCGTMRMLSPLEKKKKRKKCASDQVGAVPRIRPLEAEDVIAVLIIVQITYASMHKAGHLPRPQRKVRRDSSWSRQERDIHASEHEHISCSIEILDLGRCIFVFGPRQEVAANCPSNSLASP